MDFGNLLSYFKRRFFWKFLVWILLRLTKWSFENFSMHVVYEITFGNLLRYFKRIYWKFLFWMLLHRWNNFLKILRTHEWILFRYFKRVVRNLFGNCSIKQSFKLSKICFDILRPFEINFLSIMKASIITQSTIIIRKNSLIYTVSIK